MTTTTRPKTSRSFTTVAILAAVAAVAAGIVVFMLVQSGPTAPAGQFHVSIRGNLGATVTVDGKVTTLRAETGYDSGDFTGQQISVVASSSGAAPNCRITDGSGVELAAQVGDAPEVGPQTVLQGYGPAKSIEAPSIETASCTAAAK
jgi:hypothetical protein